MIDCPGLNVVRLWTTGDGGGDECCIVADRMLPTNNDSCDVGMS